MDEGRADHRLKGVMNMKDDKKQMTADQKKKNVNNPEGHNQYTHPRSGQKKDATQSSKGSSKN